MANWEEGAQNTRSMGQRIIDGIADGIEIASTRYWNDLRQMMVSSPRSGRLYRRRTIEHKASAPGEPPAPDRGSLLESIKVQYIDRQKFEGAIASLPDAAGSRVVYAPFLEYGTAHIAPRPAWRPTAERIAKVVGQIIMDAVRRRVG